MKCCILRVFAFPHCGARDKIEAQWGVGATVDASTDVCTNATANIASF